MENYVLRYEKFRCKMITEFRFKIKEVMSTVLSTTESISENDLMNFFMRYPEEISILSWSVDKDDKLKYTYDSNKKIGTYNCNLVSFENLRNFIQTYYQGIELDNYGWIDAERKTISLSFSFEYDSGSEKTKKHILKSEPEEKKKLDIIEIFIADLKKTLRNSEIITTYTDSDDYYENESKESNCYYKKGNIKVTNSIQII